MQRNASHGGGRPEPKKTRTFVLVSNVPLTLTSKQVHDDLRLKSHGFMKAIVLPNDDPSSSNANGGYALALYDSTAAALEACDSELTLTVRREGGAKEEVPITLQAVQHEAVHTIEDVYKDELEVEGEVVKKSALAPTKGLQQVLSSTAGIAFADDDRRVTPKWCNATRLEQDCARGTECKFLHLAKFQRTQKPVKRAAAVSAPIEDISTAKVALEAVGAVVRTIESTTPSQYRGPHVLVPLTALELLAIAQRHDECPDDADLDAITGALATKISASMSTLPNPAESGYFVRIDVSHGAPTDAPFAEAALPGLLARVPRPVLNTPLDRDAYLQRIVDAAHRMTAVTSGCEALRLLAESGKVQEAVDAALGRARGAGLHAQSTTPVCSLAIQPHYAYQPVPYGRAVVVIEYGQVHCTLQRDADVNASLTRLSDHDAVAWLSSESATKFDLRGLLPTQHAVVTERIEKRANSWLHQFATVARLHLAMAGRANDTVCYCVALPYLGRCVDAWLAGTDVSDADLPTAPVVVISNPRHADVVGSSLYPQGKPKSEGEVRWRRIQNVPTQHMPTTWQRVLMAGAS